MQIKIIDSQGSNQKALKNIGYYQDNIGPYMMQSDYAGLKDICARILNQGLSLEIINRIQSLEIYVYKEVK
jgi:hypothetical protein